MSFPCVDTTESTGSENQAPTASAIPDQTINADEAFSLSLDQYFSDPDDDLLAYSANNLPPGIALSNGFLSGTPTTPGTYTVEVQAEDPDGLTNIKIFNIAVISLVSFEKPLISRAALNYLGSFRITDTAGLDGRLGFSQARIAVSPETNSFFFAGNPFTSLAEYTIPDLVNTEDLAEMNFTGDPIQNYVVLADRINHTTEGDLIRNFGPMKMIDGKLFATVFDPYDAASAAGFSKNNMLRIEEPFDLQNTPVTGYFEMEDNMFAAGWLSPIPVDCQAELGGDWLTGSARLASINGRWSMGPSAYSLDKSALFSVQDAGLVANNTLQRYPLHNRMAENSFNYPRPATEECPSFVDDNSLWKQSCVMGNDLWTELARAFYGQIIPGTGTYLTVGRMGGIRTGISYKNTPVGRGGACSGECPYDWSDWDNYIWLFNVEDLAKVRNGEMLEYEARPYDYGAIVVPGEDRDGPEYINQIASADYDEVNNRLYLVMYGDNQQRFESVPWVAVYEINKP